MIWRGQKFLKKLKYLSRGRRTIERLKKKLKIQQRVNKIKYNISKSQWHTWFKLKMYREEEEKCWTDPILMAYQLSSNL